MPPEVRVRDDLRVQGNECALLRTETVSEVALLNEGQEAANAGTRHAR